MYKNKSEYVTLQATVKGVYHAKKKRTIRCRTQENSQHGTNKNSYYWRV